MGAVLDMVGCLTTSLASAHQLQPDISSCGNQNWPRKEERQIISNGATHCKVGFCFFFFWTLVFYLHLANTQNYLEEITSYDGPLQNPQNKIKKKI